MVGRFWKVFSTISTFALCWALLTAQAPLYVPGSFSGGTITSPILAANGTCAAPTYGFSGEAGTGIAATGTPAMEFCVVSTLWGSMLGSDFDLNNGVQLGFSSGGIATADTFLGRSAAAAFRLGAADAAAPVAQTLGVQNVVAGTSNTAGVDFTLNGSRGTGTGAGGRFIFQVAPAGGSGTSQNALSNGVTLGNSNNTALTLNWASPVLVWTSGTLSTSNLQMSLAGGQALIGSQGASQPGITIGVGAFYGFSATNNGSLSGASTTDTGITRGGTDGALRFQNLGTTPTISSGFGTSPSVTANGTNSLFQVNVGTGGVATSGVIAFHGTWTNAPYCTVNDETSQAITNTAVATTTQVTLTGTAAWTASSKLDVHCFSN